METMFSKHSAVLCTVLVLLVGVVFSRLPAEAQNPVITSFSANGWLTCSNVQPGSTAVVEWASSPAGPWKSTWSGLDAVAVGSNGVFGLAVPMFYRVRGVAPTNSTLPVIESTLANVSVLEGSTASFGVRLSAQPAATVTVTVASSDAAKATVNPLTLTFTPANYATYQNVTVTGVQDANTLNEATTISLSSAGLAGVSVSVTVTDDDVQAIQTSVTSLMVSEGGSGTVGVRLSAQPSATVTVTVASSDAAKATVSPLTLTFTPANYATYQNVTVTGGQDANTLNEATTISLSSAGLAGVSVSVTVTDDDVQAIQTSVTSLTVGEGGSGTVGVRLSAQPSATVTVTVASSDPAKATVNPLTLTFTPANYATYQNVTVTGVNDADALNETLKLELSSPGLSSLNVTITVSDDDL